jgi:hypothetical protein
MSVMPPRRLLSVDPRQRSLPVAKRKIPKGMHIHLYRYIIWVLRSCLSGSDWATTCSAVVSRVSTNVVLMDGSRTRLKMSIGRHESVGTFPLFCRYQARQPITTRKTLFLNNSVTVLGFGIE